MDTKVIQKILHHILFEANENSGKYNGEYYVDTDAVVYDKASEDTMFRFDATNTANYWLEKDSDLRSNPNHDAIIDNQISDFRKFKPNTPLDKFDTFSEFKKSVNELKGKYTGKYYVDTDMVDSDKASEDTMYKYNVTKTANQWLEKDSNLKSNTNHNDIIDNQISDFDELKKNSPSEKIQNTELKNFDTFDKFKNFITKLVDKYTGKYYVDTDNVNYNAASNYIKDRYDITNIANQWLEKDPKLSSDPNHNYEIDNQISKFEQIKYRASYKDEDIKNKELKDFDTFGELKNFIDNYDYFLGGKPHKAENIDIEYFKQFITKWRKVNPRLTDEKITEALKEFMAIMKNQGKSTDEILDTLETFPTFDKLTEFISQNDIYLKINNEVIKHWLDTAAHHIELNDISKAIQQFDAIRNWYIQNKIDIPLEYTDPEKYVNFLDLLRVIQDFKRNNIYNNRIKSRNVIDKNGNRIYYSQHITNFQDLNVLLSVSSAISLRTKMTKEVFNFVYFVLNFDIYVFNKDQMVSSTQKVDDSVLLILVSPINNSPIVYAADGSDYTNDFNTYRKSELRKFIISWDKNITTESKNVNYQSIDFSVPFQEGKINGTLVKSVKTNTVPINKIQNIINLIPTMKTNVYLSDLLDILLNNEDAKIKYSDNILDGECTFYYPHSDNIHKKINYVKGFPGHSEDGPSIVEYKKNGKKKNEIFYDDNNMKKSSYIFKNNKPYEFTQFSNNNHQGLNIIYDENGQYKEVRHIKTKKNGYSFEYFDFKYDVTKNPKQDNISDMNYDYVRKMKLKSKSYFKNGVKKWSVTYERDGKIINKDKVPEDLVDRESTLKVEENLYDQYLRKSSFVNVEYYPSGQIKSISYVQDTVDGIQISFLDMQANKYYIDEIAYYKNDKVDWSIAFDEYRNEVTRTGNVDPRVLELVEKYMKYLKS